ncbi:MAG: hypothetical protein NVS1B2_14940 [Vulcanimicrobiaceae bacterium]
MLRRIPELFAFADVSHVIGAALFDVALRNYRAHAWYGNERGERRERILKTAGNDTVAHCLAYTTMHLVDRVGTSGVRGYDVVARADGSREASRVAGLFALKLVDRLVAGIAADTEEIGFAQRDPALDRTLSGYCAVSEIMYADSREMRTGIENVDADPIAYWHRAIDHALFLNATAVVPGEIPAMLALVRVIEDAIASFYVYFLATSFGETVYERYGL